jgi:hypothetical protein
MQFVVAMRGTNPQGGEAGTQRTTRAFPPGDGLPGFYRQREGQLLGR